MDREPQTILIVNDAPDQLSLLSTALGKAGYRTLTVRDGEEAYRLAARERPALVVSDVTTARADGVELTRRLRADARLRNVPIILASAHVKDTKSIVEALSAGADEYLEMPFDPLRLAALVARLLERARAEAHYRDLVEQATDIIYTLDLRGRLTSLNPAGVVFLGRTQEDAVGRSFGELLGLADADAWAKASLEELRRAGARRAQARVGGARGDGARWLEFSEALICDRAGMAVGVRGVARDITARKEIEEQLRRSEERYRDLFDRANDIIYTTDNEGRYTSINRSGERTSGYSRDELLSMSWQQVVAPEQHATVREMIERKLTGEQAVTYYEIEIIAKDGRRVPLEINSQLIREDGRVVGLQGIARDVTERRRAEAALQARAEQELEVEKMRSLGQLSAGVAHNFNNALTAILGRAQLLLRSVTDEGQRHSLEVIETAARDAAEIVRRVQTFARRAPSDAFEQVAFSKLVADCLQLARTRWEAEADARGVRYDVQFENEAGAGDLIAASPSELREVFINLIFNSIEAMPEGGTLTLRERKSDEEIVLEVSDTGAGVAPDVREHIFEPFFTTKGVQGSGLGLAVSYGIIKRHGGSITVASEPGRGATFTVRLPCRLAEGRDDTGALEGYLPRRRVLIVDDESLVRDVVAEMLGELGQEVTTAAGARDALDALARADFDLMITDLSMPETDGLKLAAEARRRAPRMLIALATGYDHDVPTDAVESGLLDAVLHKPLQLAGVEAALRVLLGIEEL